MNSPENKVGEAAEPAASAAVDGRPEPSPGLDEQRPTKVLPTFRISFPKQLIILRAFAAAGGGVGKPVSMADAAKLAQLHPSTVSLITPFFGDVGLVERLSTGLIPAPEVVSFHRAHGWNPDTAAHKLAPIIQRTWFATTLLPRLAMGPVEERAAVAELAIGAAAGPKYENQLRLLVDYLEASGLVRRDGNLLREGPIASSDPDPAREVQREPAPLTTPAPESRSATVATAFAQTAEGTVRFHVEVRVDMAEFASWQPERITAFFAGIAQVLAAKGGVEASVGK